MDPLGAIDKLKQFVTSYSAALDAQLDLLGGEPEFGPYYGAVRTIIAFEASDGIAIFYAPTDAQSAGGLGRHPHVQPGFNLFSVPSATLDELCQDASCHFLRVINRQVGTVFDLPSGLPPEVPIQFEGSPQLTLLSKELFEHLEDPIPITTFAVSPIWRVEQGLVREFLPTRTKIWSPLRPTPRGDLYRMYVWTHADIWWRADEFSLDNVAAEEAARADALGLRVIRQAAPEVLSAPIVTNDAGVAAADELDSRCENFEQLLSESGDDEETIHQWLALPGNHIFLDLGALSVRSKVPFGAHVSDFVVDCAEGKYLLCEIEPANVRLFVKSGEPSSRLNHAVQQVLDWQRYIRENVRTVRAEQALPGIYEPKGLVILGRSSEILPETPVAHRWRDIRNRGRDGVDVSTYDDVIERVRQLAQTLRTHFRRGAPA